MDICVDFDGTCVAHSFPEIGKDIGAVPVLKKLVEHGNRLILFTMRSNEDLTDENGFINAYLDDAIDWFHTNEIKLFGINRNPEQSEWTESPKAYGQLYIDDAALGAPVKTDRKISKKPFIDWEQAEELLTILGCFGAEAAADKIKELYPIKN